MTAQPNPFAGFNFTPEDPNNFEGFDFTPEKELKKVDGLGRQVIKGAKELGAGVVGFFGDVVSLFDLAANKIEDVAQEMAIEAAEKDLSPETIEKIKQENLQERAKQTKTLPIPGTQEAQELSDEGIQDIAASLGFDLDVSPKNAAERISRRSLEFASTAPLFGAGALGSLAGGAGSQIAEELGFGALGQLGGAVLGSGTAEGIKAGAKGLAKAAISPIETAKKATAKTLGTFVKPEQIKGELIRDARKAGVELPSVAKIDNNMIKSLYTRSLQSGLTGDALEKEIASTTNKIVDNIKKIPSQLGGRVRESREILGQEIQEVSKDFVKHRRKEIGELYKAATDGAENLFVNGDQIFRDIQATKKALERTLIKGTEKQQTIKVLDEALGNIHTEREVARGLGKQNIEDLKVFISETFGRVEEKSFKGKALKRMEKVLGSENPKAVDVSKALDESIKDLTRRFAPIGDRSTAEKLKGIKKDLVIKKRIPAKDVKIPVNTVIDTIKDINDIVNFENFGGTNKLLLNLKKNLNTSLKPFKENTLFGNALDRANKEFGELAEIFQSDKKIANLLKNPEGKGLVKLAESPEGFDRLLKTLPSEGSSIEIAQGVGEASIDLSKRSQGLVRDLKRTLVEDAILKPMLDKRGDIDIRRASNVLANKDSTRLIKHLVGTEQFSKLKESQKFAQKAADSIEKFMNVTQSGVTGVDVAAMSAIGSSLVYSIATMNPLPLIISTSPVAGAKLFTATISDPEMVNLIIKMGKASKIPKTQDFLKAMAPELKEFSHKLGQVAANNQINLTDLGVKQEEE